MLMVRVMADKCAEMVFLTYILLFTRINFILCSTVAMNWGCFMSCVESNFYFGGQDDI